jgi:hypothetical protein
MKNPGDGVKRNDKCEKIEENQQVNAFPLAEEGRRFIRRSPGRGGISISSLFHDSRISRMATNQYDAIL